MKKIVLAPYIDQTERWVNGCESISAVMLLQAMGIPIDPDVFIARDLPHAPYWEQDGKLYGPDPMFVYPGDPHDHTGYGCYAPCIVRALQSALEHEGVADQFEVVDESGKTAAELCRYIDAGMPVVFWATLISLRCRKSGTTGCWPTAPTLPGSATNTACCWWGTTLNTTGSTTRGTTMASAASPKRWWSSAMPHRTAML